MNISQTIFKRIFIVVQLFLIAFISVSTITAQTSSVDLSFNPVVSKTTGINSFITQPDSKILTYGTFQVVNGVVKTSVARLNADGSLDNSFNCTACDFNIRSVLVQPDGKIIVAGSLPIAATATTAARLKRLNANGSLDTSFNPTSPINDANNAGIIIAGVQAIQPDGKILVSLYFFNGGFSGSSLNRLNPDGSFDTTFTGISFAGGRLSSENLTKVSVLPGGKLLISTNFVGSINTIATLKRYNSDGTLDTTFESPTLTGIAGPFANGYQINDFEVLSDGSIVIVGSFNTVNAVSRVNIAKLQSAGNVDLSFAPTNVFQNGEPAKGVEIYSNGKILVSTDVVSSPGGSVGTNNRLIRYNADGSVDNTFTSPADLLFVNKFVIDSSDSVLLYGAFTADSGYIYRFARLNSDGSVASSFIVNYGTGGSVSTAAIQADGRVLIGGDFMQVGNVFRNKIARLDADGSVDQTFNLQLASNYTINKIATQSDGKVLLVGSFNVNNNFNLGLIRLNSDGSLDTSFNPVISNVRAIVQQPDGKILVGGSFTAVNGQLRAGLVRLNSDGTTDTSFTAMFANGASIASIISQSDGKIVAGGSFSGINGFNRTNLVKLSSDGTLDSAFNAGNISSVSAVEFYPNDKYVVATGSTVVVINNNGTTDAGFQSPTLNGAVNTMSVQPGGAIIIGGSFTPNGLVRLKSDGTIDTSFLPTGANNTVRVIVRQGDGKLVVGGDFTMIADVARLGVARLNIVPVRAKTTLFDFDGDGKADLAVYRPSNGMLYKLISSNNSFEFFPSQFGSPTDLLPFADYDGDGKTDIGIFRESTFDGKAFFYILRSADNSFTFTQFGSTGDLPIPGDWDGDGKDDLAVYRNASTAGGQSFFLYRPSSQPEVDFRSIAWGTMGDKPVRGDFDGDGKLDAAVFRPSNGVWYILQSSNNQVIAQQFGLPTDILVPADYDGDGKTNIAVFRPSTGYWYTSTDASTGFGGVQFGSQGDVPVPADYDGDGKADVAVYRPSNGVWYLLRSTAGFTGIQFGAAEDKPIPNIYIR